MSSVALSGKYQAYPEYHMSGIQWLGATPAHWDISALRWYIEIASGEGLSNTSFDKNKSDLNQFRVIGGNGTVGYSAHVNTTRKAISIGRVGALCGNIHFINEECWITDNSLKLSSWRNFHDGYFTFLLKSANLNNYASTTAQPLITGEQVKSLQVSIPPLIEQQKIANFLDHETAKIDTLIEKQQQLIKLLKEKRQAVISHAVTKGLNPDVPMRDSGVEWLGEVPEHWRVVPIKYLVSIPVTDGPHETPEFLEYGIPFISAEAVSSGKINFEKIRAHISEEDHQKYSLKYSPEKYDIYMVKSGATTGVTAIVETDKVFNIWSPLAVIRCKKDSNPYFVLNFMRSYHFKEAVELNWSFGTQQNIGMGVIENLYVTRPPVAEAEIISNKVTKKCKSYDAMIDKSLIQIDLMKERRTALISAAVTGKIDVRNWQAPTSEISDKEATA